ncbi:MAG: hypothetical protein MIO92_09395, partial [Methanosarcinaceae archaeon]|nr:hypothetical protein [Methanosarcinaceae archaeon]
ASLDPAIIFTRGSATSLELRATVAAKKYKSATDKDKKDTKTTKKVVSTLTYQWTLGDEVLLQGEHESRLLFSASGRAPGDVEIAVFVKDEEAREAVARIQVRIIDGTPLKVVFGKHREEIFQDDDETLSVVEPAPGLGLGLHYTWVIKGSTGQQIFAQDGEDLHKQLIAGRNYVGQRLTVSVVVRNRDGRTGTATTRLTISSQDSPEPLPVFISPASGQVESGQQITLSASTSSFEDSGVILFSWDDGKTWSLQNSGAVAAEQADIGTIFSITVMARDARGRIGEATAGIRVVSTDDPEKAKLEKEKALKEQIEKENAEKEAAAQQEENVVYKFGGTAPSIWKGGNWEKDSGERGFNFERTKAEGGPLDEKLCPGKASVNGTVSGKINPSFSPRSEEEILKELQDRAKWHKSWFRDAEIKPYSIGDFKGYLLTTKMHYSRGYYDGGYVGSGTSAYGEGWVLKGQQAIRVDYHVGGGGCFNNSQRAFQESQTKAAKSEAESILAGLKLVGNGNFTSTLYTGPKLDGSDMLKVSLIAYPEEPSFLGDTVEVTANVSGGEAPYTYVWSGDHGGKGTKVVFASRKEGDHQLSVTVTDSRGDTVTANITIKVEALEVTVTQVSPKSSNVLLGTPVEFVASIKGGNKKNLEQLWQPHPEVTFEPFENSLNTKATFSTLGTQKVWIQIFKREGEVRTTVGESDQVTLEVVKPTLKLIRLSPEPYVGDEVKLRVDVEKEIDVKLIDFWWEIDGKTLSAGVLRNNQEYTFKPKDTKSVKVTVHAIAKDGRADLGEESITIVAKKYEIAVSKPKRLGPPPRKWDPIKGTAVELPQAIAVFQNAEIHATVMPQGKSELRYSWIATPEGCTVSAPLSKSTYLNAHETGTYQIVVKVSDKNGIELGKGTGSFTATVSQRDLDVAKQKAKDQQKAKELLQEGRALWNLGKLQLAIATVDNARRLADKDKEIAESLNAIKIQKEHLDAKLQQTVDLIQQDKLNEADKVLSDAAIINDKYLKYKEVLQQLTDAKKKAKEEMERNELADQLHEKAKTLWGNGELDKAIEQMENSAQTAPENSKITKELKAMQNQKKILDDALSKADQYIEQKKLEEAKSALEKVGLISKNYPLYVEIVKKLDIAQKKAEEEKRIAAEKIKQEQLAKEAAEERKKAKEEAEAKQIEDIRIRSVKTKTIKVTSDENIIEDRKPELAVSVDRNNFILDGNDSRGWVRLLFEDPLLSTNRLKSASLIVNISNVANAESQDGFIVFLGNTVIGRSSRLTRNTTVEVPINISLLGSTGKLEMILRAAGDDGVYIKSKASGQGAALELNVQNQQPEVTDSKALLSEQGGNVPGGIHTPPLTEGVKVSAAGLTFEVPADWISDNAIEMNVWCLGDLDDPEALFGVLSAADALQMITESPVTSKKMITIGGKRGTYHSIFDPSDTSTGFILTFEGMDMAVVGACSKQANWNLHKPTFDRILNSIRFGEGELIRQRGTQTVVELSLQAPAHEYSSTHPTSAAKEASFNVPGAGFLRITYTDASYNSEA